MKVKNLRILKLLPLGLLLLLSLLLTYLTSSLEKNSYYEDQLLARNLMKDYMQAVKGYKAEKNIPIYDYDYFNTGLLGDDYNDFTTSLGNLEAKRTSANPDMAALVVKMFHQINLEPKNHVAVGLSGSFPGLNLAVIAAGEAMDLDYTIISSYGASTFGANQEGLSFPVILDRLHKDGYTKFNSDIVSLGGDDDTLSEKPADFIKKITDQYEELGLNIYVESDFNKNVEDKIRFYEKKDVDAYIAVGGNITFLGIHEKDLAKKQGILNHSRLRTEKYSYDYGIIDYFLLKDIPTIHLLNIKKIVADYGLPFDPISLPQEGQSNVYFKKVYKKYPAFISLGISALYLLYIAKDRYRND